MSLSKYEIKDGKLGHDGTLFKEHLKERNMGMVLQFSSENDIRSHIRYMKSKDIPVFLSSSPLN